MSDVQEALRFLESECYGEVQCPPRTEAANTIRAHIEELEAALRWEQEQHARLLDEGRTLAAERDGLLRDLNLARTLLDPEEAEQLCARIDAIAKEAS